MKHLLPALALVALLSYAAAAEETTWGIKGGINLADLEGDGISGNEMKLVGGGGIFFNRTIANGISIQPEVLFMMKGTKSESLENTGIHLTYIDIPVLVRYSIPTETKLIPYFLAGPSFGILMSATYEVLNVEEDIKDDLKSIDYCLVLGAGADYAIGEGRLIFDVRYSFGLTTIVDESDDEGDEVKNTGIIFMVGYGYSF
jgi:hypothetical protein